MTLSILNPTEALAHQNPPVNFPNNECGLTKRRWLNHLPEDVLLETAVHLPIKDLISLLSTCRHLYHLSENRHIWLEKLRNLEERYRVYPSVDRTEMTPAELKSAATRPFRFERLLAHRQGFPGNPPTHLKIASACLTFAVEIVPGGEYIVVLARRLSAGSSLLENLRDFVIQVYRVQRPASVHFECVAELALPEPYNSGKDLRIVRSRDGTAFRAFVYATVSGAQTSALFVVRHEIKEGKHILDLESEVGAPGMGRMTVDGSWVAIQVLNSSRLLAYNWEDHITRNINLPWNYSRGRQSTISSITADSITCWVFPDGGQVIFKLDPKATTDGEVASSGYHLPDLELQGPAVSSFAYPFRHWTHGASPSVLIPYQHSTAIVSENGVRLHNTDNSKIGATWYLPKGRCEAPAAIAETANGHVVSISSNCDVTFLSTQNGERSTRAQWLFPGVSRNVTPMEHPFVCPFSGTIGALGSWGDLYIFQMD